MGSVDERDMDSLAHIAGVRESVSSDAKSDGTVGAPQLILVLIVLPFFSFS